jgi:hypothetical protein
VLLTLGDEAELLGNGEFMPLADLGPDLDLNNAVRCVCWGLARSAHARPGGLDGYQALCAYKSR